MQSGITASQELRAAFQELARDPSQRGLVAGISAAPETLVPLGAIPSTSADFHADLANLAPLLHDNKAAYIILRHGSGAGPAAYHAVTYVPDAAPVRQKMLFAATRLTLVRELGSEHFAGTLFATSRDELSAAGWARHEAHGSLAAPLTDEERNLQGIRDAEAQESTGTGARKAHVSSGVQLKCAEDVVPALRGLRDGDSAFVQLSIDVAKEAITLADPPAAPVTDSASVRAAISQAQPQYTFYRVKDSAPAAVVFIYSCPAKSSIKQRMLFASSRANVLALAKDEAGIDVAGKIEISEPDELSEREIQEAAGAGAAPATSAREGKGFSKPKRPGRK